MGGDDAPANMGAAESVFFGGAACVLAVNFTHPIETVKTRMQVTGDGITGTCRGLMANEGVLAFWKGIPAAWGREALYASIKVGGYVPIRDALGADKPNASFFLKFVAGSAAAGLGAIVGNPFDVLKTQMQTNKDKKGISMGSLGRDMYAKGGISAFYRGAEVNVMRACVLGGTKMACYDQSKSALVTATGWNRKDVKTSFVASVIAGFAMTITVAPFDMVRTKLQNQPADQKIYEGFVDCVVKVFKQDGPGAFYRGFIPIWARFAPSATLQLLFYEYLVRSAGYKGI
eukprot:gb/GEZN01007903.1/.p1 GENE.gb/GEZN01007903.1/~~gb/GEZN01007903.1/.p1  ORF type:complete len:288 (-),score=46.33 gb/GEZN01007903.1/:270-1133(-)